MAVVDVWPALLVAGTALHAGFQAGVTALVYPALADVPAEQWERAHDRHSRRITPLVVGVYGAVLLACAGTLVLSERTVGVWLATVATAGAFTVTAGWAAPLHARLGRGRDPALVTRLLVVDRWRLGFAVVAALAAVLAGA